jgi:uncharacterized membrane protein YtjA (UPF0391 family)
MAMVPELRQMRREQAQPIRNNKSLKGSPMLGYAITFLIIALIAGFLGFIGIAGLAAEIAKICFFVFLVLFILSLVAGRRPPV